MGPKIAVASRFGNRKRSRGYQLAEARKKRLLNPSEESTSEINPSRVEQQASVSVHPIRVETDLTNDIVPADVTVPVVEASNDGREESTVNDLGQSASGKKLSDFRVHRLHTDNRPTDTDNVYTFSLVDIRQLNELVVDSGLLCPECLTENTLTVSEGKNFGFSVEIVLSCEYCEFRKVTFSSRRSDNSGRADKPFVVNDLAVLYSHEIGKGHSALDKFAAVFGMKGLHLKTYQAKDRRICKSYITTGKEVCAAAVKLVRMCYIELNDLQDVTDDDVIDITVSFDGTWQKRGFTSLYGIGTLIEVMTGYCIDFEIFSKYCHACALAANAGTDTEEWRAQHLPDCAKNYDDSSKSMEQAAAVAIWGRSIDQYKLRYTCVISDGDSSAYRSVCNSKPYGDNTQIEKLECVNHCHKRMGTALRELAKDQKLGGKGHGRLTKSKCETLQNYYRGAIINNLHDADTMRERIWASLFHSLSTDDKPHHTRCPPGTDSWCRWQRAEALDLPPPSHTELRTALSCDVAEKMLPIYKRMSDPNLLKRLTHGKTQNANESINNLIWVKCPKTVFVGKLRVEAAVGQAVARFNEGARNLSSVMENLGIESSEVTNLAVMAEDAARIRKADRQSETSFISQRKSKNHQKKIHVAHQEEAEGQTYAPGLVAIEQ